MDLPLRRSKTMIGFHCLMVVAILVVEANLAERKFGALKIRQLDWTVFLLLHTGIPGGMGAPGGGGANLLGGAGTGGGGPHDPDEVPGGGG